MATIKCLSLGWVFALFLSADIGAQEVVAPAEATADILKIKDPNPRARLEKYLRTLSPEEREKVILELQQKRKARQRDDQKFMAIPSPTPNYDFQEKEIGPDANWQMAPAEESPRPTPEALEEGERPPGVDDSIYKPRSASDEWRPDLLWRPVVWRLGPGINFLSRKFYVVNNPSIVYDVVSRGAHFAAGIEFPLGKVFSFDLGAGIATGVGNATANRDDIKSVEELSFLFTHFDLGFLYTPRGTQSGVGPFLQTSYLNDNFMMTNKNQKIYPVQSINFRPGVKLRLGLFDNTSAQFEMTQSYWGVTLYFNIPVDQGVQPSRYRETSPEVDEKKRGNAPISNLE